MPDVVGGASYYCDILGFDNRGFFGDPPVFAMLGREEVELFFNQSPDAASHVRPRAAVGYDAYIHITGLNQLFDESSRRCGPMPRTLG